MASIELLSQLQISAIESNKMFRRLSEKTQVSFPRQGMPEVLLNRLTHSYEVATSASVMAYWMAQNCGWAAGEVDHQGSVKPASLLHDIGHSGLGHPVAHFLNDFFREHGLDEGFCDNNNVLVVIEKNNIMVSNHTIASVIKYPDSLYPYQKEHYTAILKAEILRDQRHFAELGLTLLPQNRTIACQIMDEADRNTYVCSDMADFLCVGNTLPINELKQRAEQRGLVYRYGELQTLFTILKSNDKSAIKAYFNNLKNRFNMNFALTESGVTLIDADLHAYREFLWDIEYEYYIQPIRREPFHLQNMAKMEAFLNKVMRNELAPSRTYAAAIQKAQLNGDVIAELRAKRDMVAETTDLYLTQFPLD